MTNLNANLERFIKVYNALNRANNAEEVNEILTENSDLKTINIAIENTLIRKLYDRR